MTIFHNHTIRSYFFKRHMLFAESRQKSSLPPKNKRQLLNLIFHNKNKILSAYTSLQKKNLPAYENKQQLELKLNLNPSQSPEKERIFAFSQITEKPLLSIETPHDPLQIKLDNENDQIISVLKNSCLMQPTISILPNTDLAPQNENCRLDVQINTYNLPLKKEPSGCIDIALDPTFQDDYKNMQVKSLALAPFALLQNLPPLLELPSLKELMTLSYKDNFDIDISFTPTDEDSGYFFAITLIPRNTYEFKRIKQNIFFLVDKSNSILQNRLTSTRHAIISALHLIDPQDTFNIYTFDSKTNILFSNNHEVTNSSLLQAKSFLTQQTLGSFFSTSNIFVPFSKALSEATQDEINIAILFTNGESFNKSKNYKILSDWSKSNKGSLTLYTVALNEDKNVNIMDFFSSINKGKLITAPTNSGIKRKLQKLIKTINFPVAKNIVSTAVTNNPDVKVQFFSLGNLFPDLYVDEPYIILGRINKLEDFTLFLQGRQKDKWFNIKKEISFENAKQSDDSLKKMLAERKASFNIEDLFKNEDPYQPKYIR